MERIYLDHNATTPIRPEVLTLWQELTSEGLANPSSLHASGRRARHLVDEARERVAAALGVAEDEITFTTGATEANSVALLGCLRPLGSRAGLVTTETEHASVLEAASRLEREGHPVARVGVDERGVLDSDALLAGVRSFDCRLVSVQTANNETGALQPIGELADRLTGERASNRPWLHVDAVQSLGKVPVQLSAWGISLATFSAHKLGGPPGVGVLVCARGTPVEPLTYGGGQEGGLWPGTESVASIAAAARAIELAVEEQERYRARTSELTRGLWERLRARIDGLRVVGPPVEAEERLPNTLNVLIPGTDGRVLVTALDLHGLEVSAGSACASGALEPSHVLIAMGYAHEAARAALRITLGRTTTASDCARAVDILEKALRSSRAR